MLSSYCVIRSLMWSSTTVFILMMPRRSAGHSSKGISSRSENATPPAVSSTLQTRSLHHRTMDATSSVGSVCPSVKRQQRSWSTTQSAEDLAGSWPLTAQDGPTIVQVVLNALPSRIPVPLQSSDAEVAPSPGTSRDNVPMIGQLPPPSQITRISQFNNLGSSQAGNTISIPSWIIK